MSKILQESVGECVAKDFRTAAVFKKYDIDFCCGGGVTIEAACKKVAANYESVLADLTQILDLDQPNDTVDFNTYPLDKLIDYIENTHHTYVENRSLEIKAFLQKVVKVHGDRAPELMQIEHLFNHAVGDLAQHMKKEELILFPAIKRMLYAMDNGLPYQPQMFQSIQQPIARMEEEHHVEGNRFDQIEKLSGRFTPPDWACTTYQVTYRLLEEFQQDLHRHIHLENNILFPRAIQLERELKSVLPAEEKES